MCSPFYLHFTNLTRTPQVVTFRELLVEYGIMIFFWDQIVKFVKLQNIAKQVCTLLRAIAGNDDVKTSIVDAGGLGLIVAAMMTHAKQPMVAEQGCAALGSIALRSPSNCTAIVGAGGVEAILKAMELHADSAGVQVGRDFARTKSTCSLSRDDALVRALSSHQCGLGWMLGLDITFGLSLLLVLIPALRGFSDFPPPTKTNIFKFQFNLETVDRRGSLCNPLKFQLFFIISLIIYSPSSVVWVSDLFAEDVRFDGCHKLNTNGTLNF